MFKRKSEREAPTPRQKQMRAVARLGACAYLIYVIYKLYQSVASGDPGINITLAIAIIVVLSLIALSVIIFTLVDIWRHKEVLKYKKSDDFGGVELVDADDIIVHTEEFEDAAPQNEDAAASAEESVDQAQEDDEYIDMENADPEDDEFEYDGDID